MTVTQSTITTPTEYAQELLDLANSALSFTTRGSIGRAYLSPGEPALDCETLTVQIAGFSEATTNPTSTFLAPFKRHVFGRVNLIAFRITVARDCIPTSSDNGRRPPLPAELQAAAEDIHEDVWAIWTRVYREMREGNLFGGRCDSLFMTSAEELETSGGVGGYTIDLATNIAGLLSGS